MIRLTCDQRAIAVFSLGPLALLLHAGGDLQIVLAPIMERRLP